VESSIDQEHALQTTTLAEVAFQQSSWNKDTAIEEKHLSDPRIINILSFLRDVESIPSTWGKSKNKWIDVIVHKYNSISKTTGSKKVSRESYYRWKKQYEDIGIVRLVHKKPWYDQARFWTKEALDFWISLNAKREHRRINKKDLYELLCIEAKRNNWRIGGLKSANWWFKKRWNPCLDALQRGGMRALDNILPPILRDYSDLAPFQILVGDQHRFDRWVMDEETGEIFRPEGYLWQDLRTRIIYGAAVDKKYDAWLIGLALRIGISCYGTFQTVYTDNGRPECSRFLTSILANLRSNGMEWEKTDELVSDLLDVDDEEISPACVIPGSHRKAIVKNAKAKMIEGSFHRVEQIMASVMLLPGGTKRMSEDIHWQDIDQQEAQKLAAQGKLLTSREFALAMYRAIDYYNNRKPHRGVRAEWLWKPVPAQVTPIDCLRACYNDGWRPRRISNEAADLLFLARATRIINKGIISLNNEQYCHDALIERHKERVDVRFNPMTFSECLVFHKGKYICTALPVQYSSMINSELTSKKITEKRERRKRFAEEFKKISAIAPDFRRYSQIPKAERVAAVIGAERKRREIENKEYSKEISQQELDKKVHALEILNTLPPPKKILEVPPRPNYWLSESARFEWCLRASLAGAISSEDLSWMTDYENAMSPGDKAYTNNHREFMQTDYDQIVMAE